MVFLEEKRMVKITFIFILFGCFISFICFRNFSYANTDSDTDNFINSPNLMREAIIETADAFYRKGKYIQYDGYRKTYFSSPEQATSQNNVFTVCSAFTYQVYYQTLGIEIPKLTETLMTYAKNLNNLSDSKNLIYYNDNMQEIDTILSGIQDENNTFLKKLANEVLPGDILVIRRKLNSGDDEGHVMLINQVENGIISIMHSSGSTYSIGSTNTDANLERYEEKGSIRITSNLKDYLVSEYNKTTSDVSSMGIIRIITDDLKYPDASNLSKIHKIDKITDSAASRLKYPGIDIDKVGIVSGNTKNNMVVGLDDIIEYKITISNNSDNIYKDLKVEETLSENVIFQTENSDTNVEFDEKNLIWTIKELASGKKTTISYKVKVKNDISYLKSKTYIVSNGRVDNISNAEVIYEVGINLTEEEKTKLLNSFDELKTTENSSGLEFIVNVYENAGLDKMAFELKKISNEEPGTYKSAKDLVKVTNETCLNKNDYVNFNGYFCAYGISEEVSNILLSNYYGVRLGTGTKDVNNPNIVRGSLAWNIHLEKNSIYERARFITEETLEVGDIVMVYGGVLSEMYDTVYMCIAPGTIVRKFADSYSVYTLDGTNRYYKDKTVSSAAKSIAYLRSAIGDNYVILRPSLINYKEVESIEIESEKTSIEMSEKLNLNVIITPLNATNKNIIWSSSNPSVATVDNNGMVIGKEVGTSIITASIEKQNGELINNTYAINVEKKESESDDLNDNDTNLDNDSGDKEITDNESEKITDVPNTSLNSDLYIFVFSMIFLIIGIGILSFVIKNNY